MSSHREAPEISKDPVADSTDVYAFVSPDKPDTVTLIANYIPLQSPAGGPNFYEFGDDVLYEIHIDNNGDGEADITYQFRFHTTVRDPETVPVQHRPDHVARQPQLEPPPDLRRVRGSRHANSARHRTWPARRATSARCPRRTTPQLAAQAVHQLRRRDHGVRRAARRGLLRRPRRHLRPRRPAAVRAAARHVRPAEPSSAAPGVNATNNVNVHSIAIQVPISRA